MLAVILLKEPHSQIINVSKNVSKGCSNLNFILIFSNFYVKESVYSTIVELGCFRNFLGDFPGKQNL